jgi:hypothetical protein
VDNLRLTESGGWRRGVMKQKFIQLFIGLVLTTKGRYVGGERVPRENLTQCFTVFLYKISQDLQTVFRICIGFNADPDSDSDPDPNPDPDQGF